MPSFFLMIRRPPRSTLFPYTTSSDLLPVLRRYAAVGGPLRVDAPLHPLSSRDQDRKSTRLNSSHSQISHAVFFFNDTAPTEIYPLSLHDLFRSSTCATAIRGCWRPATSRCAASSAF